MSEKYALLISSSNYDNPAIPTLKSPASDTRALAEILRDPQIGGFKEVETHFDKTASEVLAEIEVFFSHRMKDDLLFLYFSGHGIIKNRRLHLATYDTAPNRLFSSTLHSLSIVDLMDSCRSKRQLLVLDCCHSGAFADGRKSIGNEFGMEEMFRGNGYGRFVLTASDTLQSAWEDGTLNDDISTSRFTNCLIEGLRSGDADLNKDGYVSIEELYQYTYKRVMGLNIGTQRQTPKKWAYDEEGEFIIARTPSTALTRKATVTVLKDRITNYKHALPIGDPFYVMREDDHKLKHCITKKRQAVTIYASHKSGKTSLLLRGLEYARQNKSTAVFLDMEEIISEQWKSQSFDASLLSFVISLAEALTEEGVKLDVETIKIYWEGLRSRPATMKLTKTMQFHILPRVEHHLVLGLDVVDKLIDVQSHQEFFALLRTWINKAAWKPVWAKLTTILSISTEPHLLIDNPNQSPFNVGERLYLSDFSSSHIAELNQRCGSPIAEDDLAEFQQLFGGHPLLVREALCTLAIRPMAWQKFKIQLKSRSGIFEEHLNHLLSLIKNDAALRDTLNCIIRKKSCNDQNALTRLIKAGVIYQTDGHHQYLCRCELYQNYFKGRL